MSCSHLRTVRLNSKLRSMGNDCFRGSALESLNIPHGLNFASGKMICALRPLTVYLSDGWTEIPQDLFAESGVGCVVVPSSVKSIANGAFHDTASLQRIVFATDSHLDEIGDQAFERTGLQEFVAPAGLKMLGKGAFRGCQ